MTSAPVLVAAEFDDDALRGARLIEAARDAGASWAVQRIGADAGSARATARAAAAAGVGLVLRVDDTRAILDLEEVLAPFGERSVPLLRDRVLLVVAAERTGKRLRADAPWAPSGADAGELSGGLLRLMRRYVPHVVRAVCMTDDLLVPHDLLPASRNASLAEKMRRRGGRLWLTQVPPERAAALRDGPAHGIVLRVAR
jgi:hypothetical protein